MNPEEAPYNEHGVWSGREEQRAEARALQRAEAGGAAL